MSIDHGPPPAAHPPEGLDPRVHKVEVLISTILRTGVIVSLAVVVVGTVLSFVHHPDYVGSPPALRRLTTPGAAFPRSLRDIAAGAAGFRGQSVVLVGLLLLIATPVMRVAVSIFAFLFQKDRTFVLITATVLALLLLSFFLGKVE